MSIGEAKTYTKKPVDVKAIRFTGWQSAVHIMRWAPAYYVPQGYQHPARKPDEIEEGVDGFVARDGAPEFIVIRTLEGDMRGDLDCYVIEGVHGEFYPCEAEIFKKTYDEKRTAP